MKAYDKNCSRFFFRNVAIQAERIILDNFPGLEVSLANHPPTQLNLYVSKAANFIKLAGIAMVFGGEQVFPMLGFPNLPNWYVELSRNKIGTAFGIWVVGNMVQNNLMSTGAFEIFLDNQLIFSKLETGRLPNVEEIVSTIASKTGQNSLHLD